MNAKWPKDMTEKLLADHVSALEDHHHRELHRKHIAEIVEQQVEIERLRAALQRIVKFYDDADDSDDELDVYEIARSALKDK